MPTRAHPNDLALYRLSDPRCPPRIRAGLTWRGAGDAPVVTCVITDGGRDLKSAIGWYSDLDEAEVERLRTERELWRLVEQRLQPIKEELLARGLTEQEAVDLIIQVVS